MFLHDIPENLMGTFLNIAYSVIAADGKVTEEVYAPAVQAGAKCKRIA